MEPHSRSRIEYMVKAKSQFKSRSVANNVEIIIPGPPQLCYHHSESAHDFTASFCVVFWAVPIDVSSPSFKSSIGSVTYVPDQDAIVWTIKQVWFLFFILCNLRPIDRVVAQFNGSREYLMRAHFGLPSVEVRGK